MSTESHRHVNFYLVAVHFQGLIATLSIAGVPDSQLTQQRVLIAIMANEKGNGKNTPLEL